MKKSLIKTALLAVVLMSVFLYLSSCQKHQPIYSDIESDTRESNYYPTDYSLIYLDGGYYLKPENESDISSYEKSDSMELVPSITFSDINSLISTIRNTSFSEAQLRTIAKFPKNNGLIPIFDLDNVYYPIIKNDAAYVINAVWKEGTCYYYEIEENSSSFNYSVFIKEKDSFYNEKNKFFVNISSDNIISESTSDDGKRIIDTKDSDTTARYVEYVLEYEDKLITVQKMYVLDGPYKILSDTVPAYIHTYYQQGNLYYKIQLHPENTDVSDEVWLSFGIEKYVPPETESQPDNITE